ncbi:MAG: SDR family oxidoreductase [Hyphomicrobiaceae bacterium]|nr:SDR family oxidoreductase [Hyphomicrobiaceae bacterium]
MVRSLEDKIAVVTGASRGIGREIAFKLAKEGAMVVVHYGGSKEAAEAVVTQIEVDGGKAFAVQGDLSKPRASKALFERIDTGLKAHNGSANFDILVNNAGIATFVDFANTSEDQFDELIAVNLRAPYFLAQEAAQRLNEDGRIINFSTVVVRMPLPSIAAYSVSKGGVDVLTRTLATELGERGITVNAIAPGAIQTDMAEFLNDPEGVEFTKSKQALKRIGQADDVADLALYLASPAGRWVTGQVIEASGGSLVSY